MVIRDSFFLDDSSNTLRIDPADNDGFHICEIAGSKGKVYVYYSEIDSLVDCLKRIKMKGGR
jgi:hypothetical protein